MPPQRTRTRDKATAPRIGRLSVGLQGEGVGRQDRNCVPGGGSSHRKEVDCHRIAIFNIVEPAVLATRKSSHHAIGLVAAGHDTGRRSRGSLHVSNTGFLWTKRALDPHAPLMRYRYQNVRRVISYPLSTCCDRTVEGPEIEGAVPS